MTVSTEISREEYTGNGVTTDFDYRFRVFSADELVVSVADTTENISVLTLNTDYTVTGAGSRTGGKVKLVNPLANAWRISIERDLPVTQETDIRNQGNFFPEVHEDAWDKLTMLIQQAIGNLGLALRKPNWLAKYYDAKGNRVANLGSPVNPQDAAPKSYVDSVGDGLFKKTLRFPENVDPMPASSMRGHSLQGYTADGKPVPVFSMTDTADLALKLASSTGASLIGGLGFITPEMFGAKGDGVADDTAAIQEAINTAYSSAKYRVVGMGRYRLFSPLKVDNFGQGFSLTLQDVIADASFPAGSDWKTANGMIEVGGESNGSQVGLEIRVGFSSGNNVATLYKLKGMGAGGSLFWFGRVQDVVGVFDCTNSNKANSNSNFIEGLYCLRGVYGIRLRRSGSFVVEGTKMKVGFMTGFKYGGIQMFNGAQYAQVLATDIDFCGQYLTELTLNALPSSDVRGLFAVGSNGVSCEIIDYYQNPRTVFKVLIIEDHLTTGGNTSFSAGQTVSINGVTYTINAVVTPTVSQAYFDIIHGFQGAPFAKVDIQCGYLSRIVGGNQFTSKIESSNSFTSYSHSNNGLSLIHDGTFLRFSDRYLGNNIFHSYTTRLDVINHVKLSENRTFGTEFNTTLISAESKVLRTFSFVGDGTVTTTKEWWDAIIVGPTGLSSVGGRFAVLVGTGGIELVGGSGVSFVTLGTSGFALTAIQNAQPQMNVTLMIQRRL